MAMKKTAILFASVSFLMLFVVGCKTDKSRVASIHSVNYDEGVVIHDQLRPVTYDEKDRLISMEGVTVRYMDDNWLRGVFPKHSHAFVLVDSFDMRFSEGKVRSITYTETPIPGTGIYEPMYFKGDFEYKPDGIYWTCEGIGIADSSQKVKFNVNYLCDEEGRLKEVVFANGDVFSGRYVYEYGQGAVRCDDPAVAASIFGNPAISTVEYFLYSFTNLPEILRELPTSCKIYKKHLGEKSMVKYDYSYTLNNGRPVQALAHRGGIPVMSYNFVY